MCYVSCCRQPDPHRRFVCSLFLIYLPYTPFALEGARFTSKMCRVGTVCGYGMCFCCRGFTLATFPLRKFIYLFYLGERATPFSSCLSRLWPAAYGHMLIATLEGTSNPPEQEDKCSEPSHPHPYKHITDMILMYKRIRAKKVELSCQGVWYFYYFIPRL